MSRTRALKRLSTAVLTGAIIAATPFAFATPAHAAVASLSVRSPSGNGQFGSYKFDGTNSTITLLGEVTQATAASPLAVFVQWSYNQTDPTCATGAFNPIGAPDTLKQTVDPTAAGDNNTKLYSSVEWAPPANAAFCIRATALEGNGVTVIQTVDRQTFTVSNADDTAALVSPARGGFIGYYPLTGQAYVSGTASSNGTGGRTQVDGNGTASPLVYDGSSINWARPANYFPSGTFDATHNDYTNMIQVQSFPGPGFPTERHVGVVYLQKLTSFTGPISGANRNPGNATINRQRYVLTALDQKGQPVAGMPVDMKFTDPNNNSSFCAYNIAADNVTTNPAFAGGGAGPCGAGSVGPTANGSTQSLTTDEFGRIRLEVYNTDSETLTFTATTKFNGTYNPVVDFIKTLTLTTAAAVATSGTSTVTGHPTFPIYASQTYGAANGPIITVNLKDQNNATIDQGLFPSPLVYSYVRTITAPDAATRTTLGDTLTYPRTAPAQVATGPIDGNGNRTITPDVVPLPNDESGSDAFTIWVERDGIPGYIAGTGPTSDLLVGSPVIKFGPEHVYFQPCDQINTYAGLPDTTCESQDKVGVNKTFNLIATIFDGTNYVPVTGRVLDIVLSNFGGTVGTDSGFLPQAQNPGITILSTTTATCTTDAAGKCSGIVFSNVIDGNSKITSSDPSLGNAITSDNGSLTIDFRDFLSSLNTFTVTSMKRLSPTGNLNNKPGAPGQPELVKVRLFDQNGSQIQNQSVTFTVTQGFFTPLPKFGADNWQDLSFLTAPADGAPVLGDITNLGQTITTTTDGTGIAYVAFGTLRDAAYDATGDIKGKLTASLNSTSKDIIDGTLYSTNYSVYGGKSLAPAAANALQIFEGTFKNTGQFIPNSPAAKPSGDKAVANVNSIPSDIVATYAQQRDSFGNLVSEPIAVTNAGTGNISTANTNGSFLNDFLPASGLYTLPLPVSQANAPGNLPTRVVVASNPTADNPQTGAETVTYTWNAAKDTWLVNTITHALDVNTQTQAITDSYTINWYVRDHNLVVHVTLNPGANVPPGTPINVAAQVLDNHARPVKGLFIQILRSGPQGETSQTDPPTCPFNCQNLLVTDANGSAGYTFISSKVGAVTITTIVADVAGNEVFRQVDHATYSGFARPALTQSSLHGVVTLKAVVDPAFAGLTIVFYRQSGITGVVVPLGSGVVNSFGVATRTFNAIPGQILSLYGHLNGATGIDPYSNRVAFRVNG